MAVATYLRPLAPALVVLEGAGGLEQAVAASAAADVPMVIVNPVQVRHFARGLGRAAKTDPIDAAVLARFAAVVRPAVRARPDAAQRELRASVARRRHVRNLRVTEQHHRRRLDPIAQPSAGRLLAALVEDQAVLERQIADRLAIDLGWRAKTAILESMPGVGPVIAATVLAELPELGARSAKRLAALVGIAPSTAESGRRERPATIGGGRREVRCALYLAAVTAARCNPVIAPFYAHLLARHEARNLALVVLTILNAMLREGALWQSGAAMT